MTALEDALAALASYDAAIEDTGQNPDIVNRQDAPHLAFVLRALIAEYERLIAATNPRKTIAQISAYEAAVSIRAREIVDTRKVFEAVATPPTDDEREALVKAILSVRWANGDPLSGVTSRTAQMVAEPILAAGFRRQGPITDEWEYRAGDDYYVYPSLDLLRDHFRASSTKIFRRRKAGPWEPVETDAD